MSTGSTSSSGGAGGSGGGSGVGGGGGPCGACKFLRRKCVSGCIFAPYFDSDQGAAHFAAVHKVFGASNVSKLLLHIPAHKRPDAVVTICFEAQSRLRDPVYGCVAHIFALQQQVVSLQAELSYLQSHLATLELPTPPPLPPPPLPQANAFSMPELLSSSNLPSHSNLDLSWLFDPQFQMQQQNRPAELRQPQQLERSGERQVGESSGSHGGGDLQALARELIERHRSSSSDHSSKLPK
ncbi:LOB domain-containing protein 30-like [Phalaenopsis equestris]|uniref:LOB domain-containing protein 30-like n=1 Tax=Phalaenopsis equestris TaxID=78828 RepID=UPI0009E3CBF9|nr:LOB domain-containing protein 30-like [Phalaenopsis equestris]